MRRQIATALLVVLIWGGPAVAQQRTDPIIGSTDDPLELQQLAVQFIAANRPHDAMAALGKSLRLNPGNAESHMWMAVAFTQLEDLDSAEAQFERALEINPQLTEAHNWFGAYWARRGDLDRAIEHYRKALEDPAYPRISRARVQTNLGNTLMQKGDVEAALPLLSAAARVSLPSNDPLFALIHLSLADALLQSGRPDEAISALDSLEVVPSNARAHLIRGLANRDLGEREQAIEELRAVLRLAPGSELADRALETLRRLGAAPGQ